MSTDNQPFEEFQEIVDQCIERMIAGETMEQVLASHPRYSASLEPVLRSAVVFLSADPPQAFAVQRVRAEARMLGEVAAAPASMKSGGTVMSWLASFKSRPAVFQAGALAVGVLMFGALGIGGAAATGNTPQPVRDLFSSSSAFNVEFTGTIVSVDGDTLVVEAGGDSRTVTLADGAEISRGGDDIPATELIVGSTVEVKGTLQPDNTILALRVHLEDGDDASEDDDDQGEDENEDADDDDGTATAVPNATTTAPAGVPTVDDDDDGDDDCDNSGTGSPCDDDIDDEGDDEQGEVDDDDIDDVDDGDVNDDDGVNDDNSGPGSGEDEEDADDDSSGSGSGDDEAEEEDDSSGSGSGSDD